MNSFCSLLIYIPRNLIKSIHSNPLSSCRRPLNHLEFSSKFDVLSHLNADPRNKCVYIHISYTQNANSISLHKATMKKANKQRMCKRKHKEEDE